MIIEIEEQFCKVTQVFVEALEKLERAAKRARRCMKLRKRPSPICSKWAAE